MSDVRKSFYTKANLAPRMDHSAARKLVEDEALRAFRELWQQGQAINRLAPFLRSKPRMLAHWFYQERPNELSPWENTQLRCYVASSLRWLVTYFRARANYWEERAEIIESRVDERQYTMWRKLDCPQPRECKRRAT